MAKTINEYDLRDMRILHQDSFTYHYFRRKAVYNIHMHIHIHSYDN